MAQVYDTNVSGSPPAGFFSPGSGTSISGSGSSSSLSGSTAQDELDQKKIEEEKAKKKEQQKKDLAPIPVKPIPQPGLQAKLVYSIWDLTDKNITKKAQMLLEAARAAAGPLGVAKIEFKAGKGPGHKSHLGGSQFDIVGYQPNGQPWTPEQRAGVAEAARRAGADRFGFYSYKPGVKGAHGDGILHIGYSGGGLPPSMWDDTTRSVARRIRSMQNAADRRFATAYFSGRGFTPNKTALTRQIATPTKLPDGVRFYDLSHSKMVQGLHTPGKLQDVKGIIFHHTAGRGDVNSVIQTFQQTTNPAQYVIDRQGVIFQILPDGQAGYQIDHRTMGKGKGLNNLYTIGVELIAKDDSDVTPKQVAASKQFFQMMQSKYPYLTSNDLYGHGEVNPQFRMASEGMTAINAIKKAYPSKEPSVLSDPRRLAEFKFNQAVKDEAPPKEEAAVAAPPPTPRERPYSPKWTPSSDVFGPYLADLGRATEDELKPLAKGFEQPQVAAEEAPAATEDQGGGGTLFGDILSGVKKAADAVVTAGSEAASQVSSAYEENKGGINLALSLFRPVPDTPPMSNSSRNPTLAKKAAALLNFKGVQMGDLMDTLDFLNQDGGLTEADLENPFSDEPIPAPSSTFRQMLFES